MNTIKRKHLIRWISLFFILLIVLLPHFISMLRVVQFDTVNFDHYENVLLQIINMDNFFNTAPISYRILTIAAAIPFHILIPPFTFRKMTDHYSYDQLHALQSITLLNYFSIIALIVLFMIISHHFYLQKPIETLIVGIVSFIFSFFSGWYSLDIPVILYITITFCALRRPRYCIPLLLLSAFFNEKVFIVYSIIFTIRVIYLRDQRGKYFPLLVASLTAALFYFVMTWLIPILFPDHQSDTAQYVKTIIHNLKTTFSIRGIVLNLLPLTLLILVAVGSALSLRRNQVNTSHHSYLHPIDLLAIPVYCSVIMIASEELNIGRIIVMLYPFYIFGIASFISNLSTKSLSLTQK